jgi:CheY-like chemotaxis protein
MNGWEVAKHLRKQFSCKRPFLIAITAYNSQADRLRSQEAGIDLHLVKPVDPEELEKLLRRVQSVVGVPASS